MVQKFTTQHQKCENHSNLSQYNVHLIKSASLLIVWEITPLHVQSNSVSQPRFHITI
jgi:hypothetical protein